MRDHEIHNYKRSPKPPEILNDDGELFWFLYCRYFIHRNYLTDDVLPDLETLSFLQQQRVAIQREVNNQRTEDNFKELKDLVTQIRLLKESLKIVVRASEFHKVKTEEEIMEEKKQKKEPKIHKLTKNW